MPGDAEERKTTLIFGVFSLMFVGSGGYLLSTAVTAMVAESQTFTEATCRVTNSNLQADCPITDGGMQCSYTPQITLSNPDLSGPVVACDFAWAANCASESHEEAMLAVERYQVGSSVPCWIGADKKTVKTSNKAPDVPYPPLLGGIAMAGAGSVMFCAVCGCMRRSSSGADPRV